jgi:WD40 repeat protein
MALACASNYAPILDLKTLQIVSVISNITCVLQFSSDGNQALCVGSNHRSPENQLFLWDKRTGALSSLSPTNAPDLHASMLQRFHAPTTLDLLNAAVSRDLELAAIPSHDGRIHLREVLTGRDLNTFPAHNGYIAALVFSRGMDQLATAGSDGAVKLWEIPSGKLLASFTNHTDGVFDIDVSPDGKFIASASIDKTVRLWEVPTKRQAAILLGHRQPSLSVAFSPDGKLLASGSADATVTLWSVALRQELTTFELADSHAIDLGKAVQAVAFSPDNQTLVARTADGTVRVWRAAWWDETAEKENNSLKR